MQDQDPSEGIDSAYCVCASGGKTTTAGFLSNVPSTAVVTASCDYTTMPGAQAAVTPTNALGSATTNTALCQICTRYAVNEDTCTTMSDCTPVAAAASVTAGTSPVHVGTLTGSALYTSVSSALESLCPPVTGTSVTQCVQTGTVAIKGIDYYIQDDNPDKELGQDGELTITAIGFYNVTSLRDAMIKSVASSIQYSATNKNCYNQQYLPLTEKAKRSPLGPPEGGIYEDITLCNAGGYTEVDYYDPWWLEHPHPHLSDKIMVFLGFEHGHAGDYLCDFIEVLMDVVAVLEPEFAVEDVELGEALNVVCETDNQDEYAKALTGRDVGHWTRDSSIVDYFVAPAEESAFEKRAPPPPGGVNQLVKDLWDAAPASNKVGTGAPPGVFKLDAGKSAVYTTDECVGCTAVVLFSGKVVVIGHFTEDPQFNPGDSNDQKFNSAVIDVLESAMEANKADLGENPFTAIFSPGFGKTFLYQPRIIGPGSIDESINNDFPNAAAKEKITYEKTMPTDIGVEDGSLGKILVEWKAPNDEACHYSAGVGTINLYAETNWLLQVHVNDQGEVVNVADSPGPGSGSECSLAADDGLDNGNAAGSS